MRARTSEREKFYITSIYHDCVTGEIEQDIETLKIWAQTYPRDVYPHNTLAMRYHCLGLYEESASEAREADEFTQRALALAEQRSLREAAASFLVDSAAR